MGLESADSPQSPTSVSTHSLLSPRSTIVARLLVVVAIVALASWLRLANLESNPPGIWQDEASTAVDAWSLWHTGRDRAGARLPLIARSFGDYPLALYRYLDAPIVGLGGLTRTNERLVAALSGSALVLAAGLLAWLELGFVACVGTLLGGAVCPLWIILSRYGSEAILLPTTLALGVLQIDVARRRLRPALLWTGAATIALSAYTYHPVKVFLPFWTLGLLAWQWPHLVADLRTHRRHVLGPALLFAAIVLPSLLLAFTSEGMARARQAAAWNHASGLDLVATIFGNYLSCFDPRMLFLVPSVAWFGFRGFGVWAPVTLPLIAIGLARIARPGPGRRFRAFVIFWFLAGPVCGAFGDSPQQVARAIGWLPAPQLVAGVGFASVVAWLGRARIDRWTLGGRIARASCGAALVAAFGLSFDYERRQVLHDYAPLIEEVWQKDIGDAMECARHVRRSEQIVVSPSFHLAELFAQFHFSKTGFVLGDRTRVGKGELYVVPASRAPPDGEKVCEVRWSQSGRAASFVYRGRD